MIINQKFFSSIEPILIKLKEKIGNDFIVFGSAPLYLLNVIDYEKSINDLDIAIKDEKMIPKEAVKVNFHKDTNQKLYKLIIDDVEIDIGACWEGQEDYFYKIFENPIEINDIKFANLDVTKKWKKFMVKKYNREKDKAYLNKIKKYESNKKR